jgi:hypothetical protein
LAAYQFKYCINELQTEGKEDGDSHDDDFLPKFPERQLLCLMACSLRVESPARFGHGFICASAIH